MASRNRRDNCDQDKNNRHKCLNDIKSPASSRSTSTRSTSSSSSNVEIKVRHHSKTRTKPIHQKKECKEKVREIDCYRDKKKKQHYHSDSDSDCKKKEKYAFDDVYKYYKTKLLMEENLMVTGSQAYINAYNNVNTLISSGYPVEFSNIALNNNIEYPHIGAPFCVRESGVYILFFIAETDQSSQFAIFVNGVFKELTCTGNNSGAGQLILRNMLNLQKDDVIMVRNYLSSSPLQSSLYTGGLQPGNNETYLMMKIANLPIKEKDHCHEHKFDIDCLSNRKQFLFKKLLEKMLCDKDLMLQGFNVHGTFWSTNTQEVLTESDVVFNESSNVNGLIWNGSDSNVKISEDGVYKIFFMATTNTAAQFCIAVNGIPIDYSIQGTNKGAGQLSVRSLVKLLKGDVVSIKNHTSSNSKIIISKEAGGVQKSLSSLMTVFKIAPLSTFVIDPCFKPCEQHDKYFEKFKHFLMANKCLQLNGSSAYFTINSSNRQKLPVNDSVHWNMIGTLNNVEFRQSNNSLTIVKDGIYDLFVDVITAEPVQLTLFINGQPDLSTVSGRDSGSARCIMRQFVKLKKGDVLEVKNYESHAGTVNTSINCGGQAISMSCLFMGFMLSPSTDCLPLTN
jgi:hypothetical protein